MKGTAHIIIKDSKTGEIKQDIKQNNMLTDSVYNILFDPKHSKPNNMLLSSIAEDLFGGIMLFSKLIDTNHLLPSADECDAMLGNANQGSNIVGNPHKGSLVSADVTEDSVEFNWVFGTTEGNGTIYSVCLTSNIGGEIGCNIADIVDDDSKGSFVFMNDDTYDVLMRTEDNQNITFVDPILNGNSLTHYDTSVYLGYQILRSKGNLDKVYNLNIPFNSLPSLTEKKFILDAEYIEAKDDNYVWYGGAVLNQPIQQTMTGVAFGTGLDFQTYETVPIIKIIKYNSSGIQIKYAELTALFQDIAQLYSSHNVYIYDPTLYPAYACEKLGSHQNYILALDDTILMLAGVLDSNETARFLSIYKVKLGGEYQHRQGDEMVQLINSGITFERVDVDITNIYKYATLDNKVFKGILNENYNSFNDVLRTAIIGEDRYLLINDYFFLWQINEDTPDYISGIPYFYCKDAIKDFGVLADDKYAGKPILHFISRNRKDYYTDVDHPWTFYRALCRNILMSCYYATICNLSNPVTKTSSDVMYITYTLSQEDQITQTEEDN